MTSQSALTTVERTIPATADQIFDLLARPRRHAEIDGSGAVRRVKSGPSRLALGDKFVIGMKMGIPYSTVSKVVEFEENRLIAWQTHSTIGWVSRFGGGRIWRYELQPVDGGTLVRETWDITHEAPRSKKGLGKAKVRDYMVTSMTKTLEQLEGILATGGQREELPLT
jgi:hypothetical protein